MFDDLRGRLALPETRLANFIPGVKTQLGLLKRDVESIDSGAMTKLDKVVMDVKDAESTVTQRLGSARAMIRRLAPP